MAREIGLGRAMLLGVAVLAFVLALPAIARAGETTPGSTETLKPEAGEERAIGMPMTLTVEGTADGLHRLFVYGEASGRCETWPYQEQTQKGVVALTGSEGAPLAAEHFSKSFVVAPAGEWYGVCAYLDTTASANPDVFEYGCYHMPGPQRALVGSDCAGGLGPFGRRGQVFGVMPVAEFVERRGLTSCFGGECVIYRSSADEQDVEARARTFGLREEATLREQFLHFEGVVCGLARPWAGRSDPEYPLAPPLQIDVGSRKIVEDLLVAALLADQLLEPVHRELGQLIRDEPRVSLLAQRGPCIRSIRAGCSSGRTEPNPCRK